MVALSTAARDPAPAKVRVLVVDDNEDYRLLVRVLLCSIGYEVLDVENGQVGLDACRAFHPALVLVDYEMPVMNGIEFLDAKQADHTIAEIPVVMITASDVDVGDRVIKKLAKPISAASVVLTVNGIVGDPPLAPVA